MGKRFFLVITLIIIAVTAPFTAYCSQINTLSGIQNSVEGVLAYKLSAEGASDFPDLLDKLSQSAGSYCADWYYIAFSQYGLDCCNKKSVRALKAKINELYSGNLADVKVTDMQRIAFALSACGVDIRNINGHNLLADASYNRAKVKPINSQGVNSVAYALLLLDSKNYSLPDDALTTRESMIRMILKAELPDGGFSLFGSNPDIDISSIVVQALSPYKNRPEVKEVIDKCVNIFSSRQDSTGGYKSFSNEISCESTAQVVLCLTSIGINPFDDSRFINNGKSVMDGLDVFRLDSGAFSHFKESKADNMATYQALCALVSACRFVNGEKSFYDFTEKPAPVKVKAKKQSKNTSTDISDNNSKKENKNSLPLSSSNTPKSAYKANTKADKTSEKSKKKSKTIQETTVPEQTRTVTSTADKNYVKKKKSNHGINNIHEPLYIDFAVFVFGYILLFVKKRRTK